VLIKLEFCEKCGSMMNITLEGYVCPKCGQKTISNLDIINVRKSKESKPEPIYRGGGKEDSLIVKWACPECGNPEAYQSIRVTIGEHAGINTDRSIIRYKCTKCYHVWIEY
jgi:DNA-directed RNA polymerase subunit M/transcription elongation factor TFIIS